VKRELILDFRKLEIYTFGCAANHFNNPKYKTGLPDATVPYPPSPSLSHSHTLRYHSKCADDWLGTSNIMPTGTISYPSSESSNSSPPKAPPQKYHPSGQIPPQQLPPPQQFLLRPWGTDFRDECLNGSSMGDICSCSII